MSSHSNYYKLIRDKLNLHAQKHTTNSSSIDSIETDHDSSDKENVNNNCNQTEISKDEQSIKRKKELHEWQMFAVKNYFAKCKNIKPKTRKDYARIIKDFIAYSPEINPEDLEPFMTFKFKLSNQNSEFKIPFSKTEGKYASAIKRFLESIYIIDPLGIKIEYYKRRSKTERNKPPIMTHQDVYNAYKELIDLKQYQDALILNLIYSLSIDPYVIYMLTYEGISDNREITYWDYKKTSFVTKELHKELLNDINYFKIYSEMKGMQSKDMQRSSEDEAIITGTFILNIKPTNLYNRFKRKFGNKLKWFRFTPKNVIELSEYRRKFDKSNFCLNHTFEFG